MKATELLKQQHAEVKKLFQQLKKTARAEQREELLQTISEKLQGHMQIEEELFYPAVREGGTKKAQEEMVPEAYEEHHVVKLVLEDLSDVDPEDETFSAKMTVLEELIEHHVEEEEKELFKVAEKLGAAQLEQLGELMEQRLQEFEGDEDSKEGDELEDEEGDDEDDEEEDDEDEGDEEDEGEANDDEAEPPQPQRGTPDRGTRAPRH